MNITIPEKLGEITLKQYMDFDKANKEESEGQFLIHRMINIFCGVSMRDCYNIPLNEAEDIATEIAEVLTQTTKLKTTFEHKGVTYGFIPDMATITLGEYIDLEEYLKDTSTLNKAMAVLYRPITKKYKHMYDIEPYRSALDYSEALSDMPCDVATSATLFFYNLSNELLQDSRLYSKIMESKKTDKTSARKGSLLENTDGLRPFSHFLLETLQSLMR